MNLPASRGSARYVVITGLSGSGKSTVLKALEDLGFYAVDNLPVQLLTSFVNLPVDQSGETFKAALVMDLRGPQFLGDFPGIFKNLIKAGYSLDLIFLEASSQALIRRFSQTRRQHPLACGQDDTVNQGISQERKLLAPIREIAGYVLDTSRFTVHQLKAEITALVSRLAPSPSLRLNLMSFGYKYGIPAEADMVIDVRFLANPYFVDELRALDGTNAQVIDYVFGRETTGVFLKKFKGLMDFLIPCYQQEGKSQLTLAIGCTGGRHRSVVISGWLARELQSPDIHITLRHRDISLD